MKMRWLAFLALAVALLFALPGHSFAVAPENGFCLQCHGLSGIADHKVSFTVDVTAGSTADLSSCRNCHQRTHFEGGPVETPYGFFMTADSPFTPAPDVHAFHGSESFRRVGCSALCHSVADCRACHTSVPHGGHGNLTEPYLRVSTAGELSSSKLVECANDYCHTRLPPGDGSGDVVGDEPHEEGWPRCAGCHGGNPPRYDTEDRTKFHGYKTEAHTPDTLRMTCLRCHGGNALVPNHEEYAGRVDPPLESVCEVCHNNPSYAPHSNLAFDPVWHDPPGCFSCHRASDWYADTTGTAASLSNSFATGHAPYFESDVHTTTNTECWGNGCHASALTVTHESDRNGNGISGCPDCHRAGFDLPATYGNSCLSCHETKTSDHSYAANAERHVTTQSNFAATCVFSGCHVSDRLWEEHGARSDPSTALSYGYGCGTCHSYGGGVRQERLLSTTAVSAAISGHKTGCFNCHAQRMHGYNNVKHTPGTSAPSMGADCFACHVQELGPEHAKTSSSSSAPGCNACHPSPRGSFVRWDGSCFRGGCHGGSQPAYHQDIAAKHTSVRADCSDCHGEDLREVHAEKGCSASAPSGPRCHSQDALPVSRDCTVCHPEKVEPHRYDTVQHSVGQDSGTCTSAGCHDPALKTEHDKHLAGKGVTYSCDFCHTIRSGRTQTWYKEARPWNKTCQSCHGQFGGHFVREPLARCGLCHGKYAGIHSIVSHQQTSTGASVDCATCHGAEAPGCTSCHEKHNISSIHVDHGDILNCRACHVSNMPSHTPAPFKGGRTSWAATCSACHSVPGGHMTWSRTNDCRKCHGPGMVLDSHMAPAHMSVTSPAGAPACFACHDTGGVLDDLKTGCLICHENGVVAGRAGDHLPVADPGPDRDAVVGGGVVFDGGNSYDADGGIASYRWDFGDGATGSGERTTHTYRGALDYTVSLTVTDERGFTDTETATVSVWLLNTVVFKPLAAKATVLPGATSREPGRGQAVATRLSDGSRATGVTLRKDPYVAASLTFPKPKVRVRTVKLRVYVTSSRPRAMRVYLFGGDGRSVGRSVAATLSSGWRDIDLTALTKGVAGDTVKVRVVSNLMRLAEARLIVTTRERP